MPKAPPKPTRFLVFSADGNPVANVPFAEKAKAIAGLSSGSYRGVSRNDLWILAEEEFTVVSEESKREERAAAIKARQEVARKNVEAKAQAEEIERVKAEAAARAEREWREKKRAAAEREESARREAERARQESERAEAEFSAAAERAYETRHKPVPVPALPTKLPEVPAEPTHPLLSRLRLRSPVQTTVVESLLQEFLHDHAASIADHGRIFDELRSSVDLLDQTLQSAALEDFLLKKRPLMPLDRRAQPSDVRAAAELCRLAIQVVPELHRPERASERPAPLLSGPQRTSTVVYDPVSKTVTHVQPPAKKVGTWISQGAWACGCTFNARPRDRQDCKNCKFTRPDFVAVSPAVVPPSVTGTNIHEVAEDRHENLNGKYLSAIPSPTPNIIPLIANGAQLKAPLLKAESQRRPVLIVGGVEAPEQTAWFRRALGGMVLWKSIHKHAGSSSVDPIVKSVKERKASAVIMLEELISHRISDQVKKAAKESGVPYVLGGKAGRGRLEQAVLAIERFMESHQEPPRKI